MRGVPNLGRMMATPYVRIVPMHLIVLFGAGSDGEGNVGMLILFTALKTASDLALDTIDRRWAEKNAVRTAGANEHT